MLPPEAIRVIENSRTRLVVLDPPFYSFGLWLAFLAAVALVLMFVVAVKIRLAFGVIPLIFAIVLGGLGSFLCTNRTVYTFSRENGTLRTQNYAWGMKRNDTSLPLDSISRVTVETIQYNHVLTVILTSGESFNLGNGSNRQGYYGAADAINNFLEVSARHR